jgi:NAD(P)-dependent dehydrogenase (short-subunit alcohol dehydrogenase family)
MLNNQKAVRVCVCDSLCVRVCVRACVLVAKKEHGKTPDSSSLFATEYKKARPKGNSVTVAFFFFERFPPNCHERMSAPLKAVVTGGNRGLGLEIVKIILRHAPGSHIFLGCRDLKEGHRIADTLSSEAGQVTAVHLDVNSEESIAAATKTLAASTTYLDLLVNNAGILHEEWSLQKARDTMRTNFDGVVEVTEAFLPMLHARPGHGAIVLSTSSGVGARTMGLIREEHREALSASSLDLPALRRILTQIVDDLGNSTEHPYHAIPTVTSFCMHTFPLFAYRSLSRNLQVPYGLSKMGVNLYTQMLARHHPTLCVNVCSSGFTNTGMGRPFLCWSQEWVDRVWVGT